MMRTFTNGNTDITTYANHEQIYFKGKDVARALGYTDTDDAIRKHVKDKHKRTFNTPANHRGNPRATFITEPGVYSLIFRSKLPEAEEFQDWIFSEVLPAIRKNGSYSNNPGALTFRIENEYDLHTKVVSYIRRFHPTALIIAGLGELEDTKSKRIKSFLKGYTNGQPDIIISNFHKHHRGLCIEFKTPRGTGTLSISQQKTLKTFEANGYKCLVSNDYDIIVSELNNYFESVRLPCSLCRRNFRNA